jgi:hypothetical protein
MPKDTHLAAGDVLFFSGSTSFRTRLQRHMESRWDQTAIVIPWHSLREVALLEATSRPTCADIRSHQFLAGVRIVSIREKLRTFSGSVARRRIIPSLTNSQVTSLSAFAEQTCGLPFNTSPFYAARALHRRNKEGSGLSFCCTELVAQAFQRISVLRSPPEGRPASNYVPRDFADGTEDLDLLGIFRFDAQEPLSVDPSTLQ